MIRGAFLKKYWTNPSSGTPPPLPFIYIRYPTTPKKFVAVSCYLFILSVIKVFVN